MVEDAQAVLKQQRDLAAKHYANQELGGKGGEGDDMGVHIGDINYAPPQGMSKVAKLAIAAALFASGIGAGAAIPIAISALLDKPAAKDTDTDTYTIFDFVNKPTKK